MADEYKSPYTDAERDEGTTKARLLCNATRDADSQFDTNDAYVKWVCEMAKLDSLPVEAADSYVAQHADKAVKDLEAAVAEHLAPAEVVP